MALVPLGKKELVVANQKNENVVEKTRVNVLDEDEYVEVRRRYFFLQKRAITSCIVVNQT
jgi:hypothetical protein